MGRCQLWGSPGDTVLGSREYGGLGACPCLATVGCDLGEGDQVMQTSVSIWKTKVGAGVMTEPRVGTAVDIN